MKTLKFKTNVKCTGCLSKVTPALNDEKQIEAWDLDIYTPEKILTVQTENMQPEEVIETIKKAGYTAEEIKDKQ